jgi:hypothetical protein
LGGVNLEIGVDKYFDRTGAHLRSSHHKPPQHPYRQKRPQQQQLALDYLVHAATLKSIQTQRLFN